MYLSKLTIENFRCFGEGPKCFDLSLRRGLTALVGENDSGKTAVIDALRFALGTADQEWYRLENTDFHGGAGATREIRITCKFEKLEESEQRAFVEYLTYGKETGQPPVLYVKWTAKDTGDIYRGRPYRRVEVHSGKDGDGPAIAPQARELLRATYLRPLRDAQQALSAGRGSRLAQVLGHSKLINEGAGYVSGTPLEQQELTLLAIGDLLNELLGKQKAVLSARKEIDMRLGRLSLSGDSIKSRIQVSGAADSDDIRLRGLLEKLDLSLDGMGNLGLGSNNLLFMACELLLLAEEGEGSKLLLIEEPEAHLHAQRQLQAMRFLQEQADEKRIQVIVTTHSPNLASAIQLNNLVMIHSGRAFSMAEGETELGASDYRFLQRFLDVTKANLFFARAVMIVEGDAENILVPTLARLIGLDFTKHGVSIVNVGGIGLRRYARIFQRRAVGNDQQADHLDIPVACITDLDVMPDCAPMILEKLDDGEQWPALSGRKWRAKKDISNMEALRDQKAAKAFGQCVRTFVSDEWTLEYNLALGPKLNGGFPGGLAKDVFVAARLADKDESTHDRHAKAAVVRAALAEFAEMEKEAAAKDGCSREEVLATQVYGKLLKSNASKPVAAQYLAEWLVHKVRRGKLTADGLRARLPKYLVDAIEYVCGGQGATDAGARPGGGDG